MIINKQRGGIRAGAGRPKKEPTQVISFRIAVKKAKQFKKNVHKLLITI